MNTKTRTRLPWVAIIFFMAAIGLALWSQPRAVAQQSTLPLQEQLAQAVELANNGFYDDAMTQLQAIASQNPGTDAGAQSLMEIAHIQGAVQADITSAQATYQTVISQYPGTIEAVDASLQVADFALLANQGSFASYLSTLNQTVQQFGGPDINDIMAGKTVAIGPVSASPNLQTYALVQIYSLVADRLTGQQTVTQQDVLSAIHLRIFLRQFYQAVSSSNMVYLTLDVYRYNSIDTPPPNAVDTTPPTINNQSPPDGGPHTNQFEFDLSDGPIDQSQVDLTTLKVTIDGTDVSKSLAISSDFNLSTHQRGKSDKPFEVAHVTYTSPTPFPDGVHNVTVNVSDNQQNAATANWSFTVHGNGGNSLYH